MLSQYPTFSFHGDHNTIILFKKKNENEIKALKIQLNHSDNRRPSKEVERYTKRQEVSRH